MEEAISDPSGFQAILTDDCWQHIVSRHPQMHPFRHLVVETIREPHGIYLGKRDPSRRIYRKRYLQVPGSDPNAFALPAQYTFGNAPRNLLRGPEFVATDLSLMKDVPLAKAVQFQIRAEIFNVFNTVNYNNPNGVFGSSSFGRISSAQNMRQMQLGGKLMF